MLLPPIGTRAVMSRSDLRAVIQVNFVINTMCSSTFGPSRECAFGETVAEVDPNISIVIGRSRQDSGGTLAPFAYVR